VPSTDFESTNLDLLRSLAVLLVFLGHLVETVWPSTTGPISGLARFGVLIFFVHTALVLMMSLERIGGNAREFYIRRFFRIYPLAVFASVAVLVLRIPPVPGPFAYPTKIEFAATLSLTQNFLPFKPLIIGPLWTLPYEVQMYIFLPLIFAAFKKLRFKGDAFVIWGITWIASAGFLVTQFAACFMAGCVSYKLRNGKRRVSPWLLLALVGALLAVYVRLKFFNLLQAPFCLAMGALIPYAYEIRNPIIHAFSKFIAKYSYGIYLSHAPIVISLLSPGSSWPRILLAVAITFGTSVLLYHVAENPCIQLGKTIATAWSGSSKPKAASVTA
jgi:peptidoglycan/LPS O-acetylase OafA/YrhL